MEDNKLFKALNIIKKEAPHYFCFLDAIKIEVNSDKIETACAFFDSDKNYFKILVGEHFTKNLCERGLSALLQHEILHIVLGHCTTLNKLYENKQVANIAMDAIINASIDYDFRDDDILKNGVFLEDINKEYQKNFSAYSNSSLDIYNFLIKNVTNDGKKENKGFDSHDSFSSETLDSSIEIEKQASEVINKILKENRSEIIGKGPSEIDLKIKSLENDYNFLSMFEQYLNKTLKTEIKTTFMRQNRLLGPLVKGKIKDKKPKILFVVDTSGSMGEDTLEKIYKQLNISVKNYDVTVCCGDTDLKSYENFKKGKKFNFRFSGGGGTDLNFYKDVLKKEKNFDLIVFQTDGHIPKIKDTDKIKKIFCIFDHGQKVDGYKNLTFN
jgi:predicted metal-dependent peptidase